jgi:hypothetical protein
MSFCRICGAERLEDEQRFCHNCGTALPKIEKRPAKGTYVNPASVYQSGAGKVTAERLLKDAVNLYNVNDRLVSRDRVRHLREPFPEGIELLKGALNADPEWMTLVIHALRNIDKKPEELAVTNPDGTPSKLRSFLHIARYYLGSEFLAELRHLCPGFYKELGIIYDECPGVRELFNSWYQEHAASEENSLK